VELSCFFFNFFAIVQPTSASQQQATNLFQQHWRHLNGSCSDFNSAFEKADSSLEQKSTSSPLYKNRQLTILSQQQFTFTERKTFFVFLEHWNKKNSKTSRVVYSYVFLSLHANKVKSI
jgi:hypothetical protein